MENKEKISHKIKMFLRPINICLYYLIILTILALSNKISSDTSLLFKVIFSLSTILFFTSFIPWIMGIVGVKKFNDIESLISGLILFLLIDRTEDLFITLGICGFYLIFRIIIRYKNFPILNPAAGAIGLVQLICIPFITHPFVSWWGTSFEPRLFNTGISFVVLLTLPLGLYFAKDFRKLLIFPTSLFLSIVLYLTYGLILIPNFMDSFSDSMIATFFEGTFFFATLIMLMEPKTSPITKLDQVIFSGVFAFTWFYMTTNEINGYLIYSILAANIYYFLHRFIKDLILKKKQNLNLGK